MEQLIERLLQIAEENPQGFTVFLPSFEHVTEGWIVAMKETQNCFGMAGLRKALEVALKTSNIIGGWAEDEKWYWDASMIFDNEDDAKTAGIDNLQIAIYHIETSTVIYL